MLSSLRDWEIVGNDEANGLGNWRYNFNCGPTAQPFVQRIGWAVGPSRRSVICVLGRWPGLGIAGPLGRRNFTGLLAKVVGYENYRYDDNGSSRLLREVTHVQQRLLLLDRFQRSRYESQ